MVEPQCEATVDASEVDGVSVRAMDVELCLPHTTFLNVDDQGVDDKDGRQHLRFA